MVKLVCAITLLVGLASGQAFDAVSIKPSTVGTQPHFRMENGRLSAVNALSGYIISAYKIMPSRDQLDAMLARLPKWVAADNFAIEAHAEGNPTQEQMRLMLQALLADRFGLKAHFETAETPVLALIPDKPGKMGPKLRPHSEGPGCDVHADVYPPICDLLAANDRSNGAVLVGYRNATIGQIATFVSSLGRLGRPVVDQTGLNGQFDFTLEFTKPPRGVAPSEPDLEGTTLQQALQNQLGLKLKATTASLDTLVIDKVERPSEN